MFKDLLHNLKNRFFGADSRWLDERAIAALTTAVKNGERGHGGELRLVIERRPLPGDTPLQTRAERHFSTLGLWNTEDRSAVLIYLNLAASQLYILADNGVLAVIPQNIWDDLAARTLRQFKAGGEVTALDSLIADRPRSCANTLASPTIRTATNCPTTPSSSNKPAGLR